MFPLSQKKKNSLSQLAHIPQCPALLPMRTQPFSQQFPQWQLFFPCSLFQRTYLGHRGHQTSWEWKKIALWEVKERKRKFNNTIVSFFMFSYQLSPSITLFFLFPYDYKLKAWHDVSCALTNNELIEKAERLYSRLLLWPMCRGKRFIRPSGKHTTSHSGSRLCQWQKHITFAPSIFYDTRLHCSHSSGAAGGITAPTESRRQKRSKTQCQVSIDGTLECSLLYCKNVVMYSEARGAEQKQKRLRNVYSIRALWY